nr:cyclopropane-fatty-acyl-phospholipid synthase family protein [Rhizobiaceae bacterium]
MGLAECCDDFARDAVRLTASNIGDFARGLPAKARLVLHAALSLPKGSLAVKMPDGRAFRIVGRQAGPDASVVLKNWNLPRKALTGGTIAVAETYMDGDWESPDVTAFLSLFLVNEDLGIRLATANRVFSTANAIRHWFNRNTRRGSRKNIAAHYDLGNAFYAQWLDPSMTYSSALYVNGANSLEQAQAEKYRALAEAANMGPNDHVLEIGCGWGGFAEFAAREIGCKVTGLTISREQFDYATRRIAQAGLSGRVTLKLQDYREERGTYDRIASIEMFEAVGEKYWPVWFSTLRDRLKPAGIAAAQIITINDRAFPAYRSSPDFIQRYIFPGGMLPSPSALDAQAAAAGLKQTALRVF